MTAYEIITKKRDGYQLSQTEIDFFIREYTAGNIPDYQMSALLMAIYFRGMEAEETTHLTNAYLHSGETINLSGVKGIKVDKHSTGGVGDKTSILLAPIVAAAGVPVPMISGRGLGHTGGTLDKLAAIPGFRTDYDIKSFVNIIRSANLCLNGQTENLVPADKKIYALRDVTATVQSIPLICASIMSKKLAEGIDALVLDVKAGRGAFMSDLEKSRQLAKSLIEIGEQAGKTVVAVLTNMNHPLGNTVGNWLEIRECIDCFHGGGPEDLLEVTHYLAGTMIWLGEKAENIDHGIEISRSLLENSTAWQKFLEIVKIQNGDTSVLENPDTYPESKFKLVITAEHNGWIESIDALETGLVSVQIGAGRKQITDIIDPSAGIVIHKKTGEPVNKNEPVMTVFTDKKEELVQAQKRLSEAIKIVPDPAQSPKMILEYMDINTIRKGNSNENT